jgi:hypothetical protein
MSHLVNGSTKDVLFNVGSPGHSASQWLCFWSSSEGCSYGQCAGKSLEEASSSDVKQQGQQGLQHLRHQACSAHEGGHEEGRQRGARREQRHAAVTVL